MIKKKTSKVTLSTSYEKVNQLINELERHRKISEKPENKEKMTQELIDNTRELNKLVASTINSFYLESFAPGSSNSKMQVSGTDILDIQVMAKSESMANKRITLSIEFYEVSVKRQIILTVKNKKVLESA